MTPLVWQVSMGGGDRLPSGVPSDRLLSYLIKKNGPVELQAKRVLVSSNFVSYFSY